MSNSLVRQNPGFVIVEEPVKSNPIEFVISWRRNHVPDSWQVLGRFVIDFNSDVEKRKLRGIQQLLNIKGIEFNQAAIQVDDKPSMEERQFTDAQRFKRKLTYLMNRYEDDLAAINEKQDFFKNDLISRKYGELLEALRKAYEIYGVRLKDVDHPIKRHLNNKDLDQ